MVDSLNQINNNNTLIYNQSINFYINSEKDFDKLLIISKKFINTVIYFYLVNNTLVLRNKQVEEESGGIKFSNTFSSYNNVYDDGNIKHTIGDNAGMEYLGQGLINNLQINGSQTNLSVLLNISMISSIGLREKSYIFTYGSQTQDRFKVELEIAESLSANSKMLTSYNLDNLLRYIYNQSYGNSFQYDAYSKKFVQLYSNKYNGKYTLSLSSQEDIIQYIKEQGNTGTNQDYDNFNNNSKKMYIKIGYFNQTSFANVFKIYINISKFFNITFSNQLNTKLVQFNQGQIVEKQE